MTQTWPRFRLYAFPPIALLPGVLERVRRDRVPLLLIAPRWLGRVWFLDALQRVVRLAERISGSALPSLQDIYIKRCKSRAAKIIKDSNYPGNHFFISLPSGKRFRSMMAKTERLRRSFFPQTIRLLNSVS